MGTKCSKCDADNPADSKFCKECTSSLSPTDDHKVSSTKTLQTPSQEIRTGSTFASRYKIIQELGRGGMGVVYKAEDTKLERIVALKFLPPDLTRHDESKARFIQEAQAASALQHNNICTIHEVDETEDGQLFIVMDCYEGDTLKKKIEQGPLEIENAVNIALQVGKGLSKAHKKGIVHRDIKPANVIVTDDGVVKILDFGLAKLTGQTRITKTATTMGTIAYMSPEQARGEELDQSTDIWSFGVILYQMVTGQLPFKGEYEQAVIYSILNENPISMSKLKAHIPVEIEEIVQKSLQKVVKKRYLNIEDIISILEVLKRKFDTGKIITPDQKNEQRKRRKKYVYGTAAIFSAVAVIIGLFYLQSSKAHRKNAFFDQLRPVIEALRFDEAFKLMIDSGIALETLRDEDLIKQMAGFVSIQTTPNRANVSLARVLQEPALSKGDMFSIGPTPVKEHILVAGEYLVHMSLEGMNSLEFLIQIDPGESLEVRRTFLEQKEEFLGMVRIIDGVNQDGQSIPEFLIDKYEVTNAEFLEFVSANGYREEKYWPENMMIKGVLLPWESAIQKLVDKTGISSPRFWSGGRYPEGKENHPVVGISWYEAQAYSQWAGKNLPDWGQWWRAALGEKESTKPWGDDVRTTHLRANFGFKGTQPVGSYSLGVSLFGCFDMAGNVREWLLDSNADRTLRTVVGGSWKDPDYMFEHSHAESFDYDFSSEDIGFRCVKIISQEK